MCLDIIFIILSKGRAYVRKIAHEFAACLMLGEVAHELFYAAGVCIQAPGWDDSRERHMLCQRGEDGLELGNLSNYDDLAPCTFSSA